MQRWCRRRGLRFQILSLSVKTRMLNHFGCHSKERTFSPVILRFRCWSGLGLEPTTFRTAVKRSTTRPYHEDHCCWVDKFGNVTLVLFGWALKMQRTSISCLKIKIKKAKSLRYFESWVVSLGVYLNFLSFCWDDRKLPNFPYLFLVSSNFSRS